MDESYSNEIFEKPDDITKFVSSADVSISIRAGVLARFNWSRRNVHRVLTEEPSTHNHDPRSPAVFILSRSYSVSNLLST